MAFGGDKEKGHDSQGVRCRPMYASRRLKLFLDSKYQVSAESVGLDFAGSRVQHASEGCARLPWGPGSASSPSKNVADNREYNDT